MADYHRQSTLTDEKTLDESSTQNSQLSKKPSIESTQKQENTSELQDVERQQPPELRRVDSKVPEVTILPDNPNVVGWVDDEDPNRPQNWTPKKKWFNMGIVSAITFLTPLASSMVAPGVPLIMREFHSTDQTIGSFIVSIYILGYALGPLFIAPMSEVYGRLPVYHICNVQFAIWTMACALAPNMGALLAFRLLAGIAGSCPITIGGGSIADLFSAAQRGGAMALFALGPRKSLRTFDLCLP